MVMLPRNMISPIVSPSHGTGCMVSGSRTVIASCIGDLHALAPVALGPLGRSASVPIRRLAQMLAGP